MITVKMMLLNSNLYIYTELGIRLILWILFIWLDAADPFIRHIHENEIWKYQYPVVPAHVPASHLWIIIVVFPVLFFIVDYYLCTKIEDTTAAGLGLTLAYCLNGCITSYLKIVVGRPRPDFYFRCFPDGHGNDYNVCTGIRGRYLDGRKSFPSGHSSFSFTCMVFITLYLSRKLNARRQRPHSWQLCACLLPLMIATYIASSRTCDYHHHYEDVLFGSLLGSGLAYVSFNLYFSKIDNIGTEQ